MTIYGKFSAILFLSAAEFGLCESDSIFGHWERDEQNLPVFRYTFDELRDPRSSWPNTLNANRTDHFQVAGNDAFNLIFTDHGWSEFLYTDRSLTYLNKYNLSEMNLGGGFSYIRLNEMEPTLPVDITAQCSAYRHSRLNSIDISELSRSFGSAGYFEQSILLSVDQDASNHTSPRLSVKHKLSPSGKKSSSVIDEVELVWTGDEDINITHFEYFDINQLQLTIQWIRTGIAGVEGDHRRHDFGKEFTLHASAQDGEIVVSMDYIKTPPVGPKRPSHENYFPPTIFLRPADDVTRQLQDGMFYDQTNFFFGADEVDYDDMPTSDLEAAAASPFAVIHNKKSDIGRRDMNGYRQQMMAVLSTKPILLTKGVTIKLKYEYGYESDVAIDESDEIGLIEIVSSDNDDDWSEIFNRESIHRSLLLQSMSTQRGFFDEYVVSQGSAYLYLHGADGAPRDQCLFSMPLTFLSPQLAKSSLSLLFQLQDDDSHKMFYSFEGYGEVNNALGLHAFPSDLDLFVLWATCEYVSVTGDFQYLYEELPYYPMRHVSTVLDHLSSAFYHLRDVVSVGNSGLIRLLQGDWNDGISLEYPLPRALNCTYHHGESVPNSQMAIRILSSASHLLSSVNPQLAQDMTDFSNSLVDPVLQSISSRWFTRAYECDFNLNIVPIRPDNGANVKIEPDLESQPWGLLISDMIGLNDDLVNAVEDTVVNLLWNDSTIGIRQRQCKGNEDASPLVWPAISQLMTWYWSESSQLNLAYQHLKETTYSHHASSYPTSWVSVWSGPDGFTSPYSGSDLYAGTWSSGVTPMTDFPVGNGNGDAMWLFGLLKYHGVNGNGPSCWSHRMKPNQGCIEILTLHQQHKASFQLTSPLLSIVYHAEPVSLSLKLGGDVQSVLLAVKTDKSCHVDSNGSVIRLDGVYYIESEGKDNVLLSCNE